MICTQDNTTTTTTTTNFIKQFEAENLPIFYKQRASKHKSAVNSTGAAHKMSLFRLFTNRHHQALHCETILLILYWLAFSLSCNIGSQVSATKLPDIYWNASNVIFSNDATPDQRIFEVNKNSQHDQDQVDIVCPNESRLINARSSSQTDDMMMMSSPGSSSSQRQSSEKYVIYSVSKEEFDSCKLNPSASLPRTVAVCDGGQQSSQVSASSSSSSNSMNRNRLVTITFRSFTPQPNGLEFKAGNDYYFITGLLNPVDSSRRFSPCSEQNMKVIFRVCCKQTQSLASHLINPLNQQQGQVQAQQQVRQQHHQANNSSKISLRPLLFPNQQRPPVVVGVSSTSLSSTSQNQAHEHPQQSQLASSSAGITILPIEKFDNSDTTSQSSSSSQTSDGSNNVIQRDEPIQQAQSPQQVLPQINQQINNNKRHGQVMKLDEFKSEPLKDMKAFSRYSPTPLPTTPKRQNFVYQQANQTPLQPYLPAQPSEYQKQIDSVLRAQRLAAAAAAANQQHYPQYQHNQQQQSQFSSPPTAAAATGSSAISEYQRPPVINSNSNINRFEMYTNWPQANVRDFQTGTGSSSLGGGSALQRHTYEQSNGGYLASSASSSTLFASFALLAIAALAASFAMFKLLLTGR